MYRSSEGAHARLGRILWLPYYVARRVYLWGARGVQGARIAAREWLIGLAHRLADRTDPLSQWRYRREQFVQFYERYDQLVDLLCWAARDTVHDGCDERYQEVRQWMLRHYPAIRRTLLPFVQQVWRERGETLREDPFVQMFSAPHVMQVIEQDSGDLLGRIILTREVLARYDAHLRLQAEHCHRRGLR